MIRRPPRSTLFPSTPFFRSALGQHLHQRGDPPCPGLRRGGGGHPVEDGVAVPAVQAVEGLLRRGLGGQDRKSTRLNSSHANISYAVFCLKKKNNEIHIYQS